MPLKTGTAPYPYAKVLLGAVLVKLYSALAIADSSHDAVLLTSEALDSSSSSHDGVVVSFNQYLKSDVAAMAATTSYPTNDVEERMPTSEISDAASSTSITKYIQPLLKSDSELKEEDLRNLAYYKMHNFMQIERLNMFDSPLFRRMIKLYNAEVRKYGVIKLAYRIEAEKRKSPNFMAMYEVAQFMTWLNFPHRRFFFVMKGFKFYGKKLYNTILENFRRFERTTKGS